MIKFEVGDRVRVEEEYFREYSLLSREGKVVDMDIHVGPHFDSIEYHILLDHCFLSCIISDYKLTFPVEYSDFLDKIKDRMS